MIKEDVDIFNVEIKLVVTRICDECGKEEKKSICTLRSNSRRRKDGLDLCWKCSQNKKYRKIPNGEMNEQWEHGITVGGYRRIFDPERGKRVLEHTYILEKNIGRRLKQGEMIHHIDLDKINNSVENLFLCANKSEHFLLHSSLQKCGYTLFKKKILFFDQNRNVYTREKVDFVPTIILSKEQIGEIEKRKYYIQKSRGRWFERYLSQYKKDGKWQTSSKNKHVIIGEAFLKRRFYYNEGMHHLDGDGINNSLDNLFIMGNSEHRLAHTSIEKVTASFLKEGLVHFNKEKGIYEIMG